MIKNRVKSNVMERSTGVAQEIIDNQGAYYPLSFFGWDSTKNENPLEYIQKGIQHIKEAGFGQVYIPPTRSKNYPLIIHYMNNQLTYETWETRFPMNNEVRPYTGDRFRKGDIIHNINPPEEGVMGWVCYKDSPESNTGEWRAWGELKRFCSEAHKVEALPIPQEERDSQVVFYLGQVYICRQHEDKSWRWDRLVVSEETDLLDNRLDAVEPKVEDLIRDLAALESGLDWRESVDSFDSLSTVYPEPGDGWTVNVKDTDITYRYDGTTWIPISANSIPLASQTVDGKMSKVDKKKLDELVQGFCYLWLGNEQKADSNTKNLKFDVDSGAPLALKYNGTTSGFAVVNLVADKVAYCKLSDGYQAVENMINKNGVHEVVVIMDASPISTTLKWNTNINQSIKIRFEGTRFLEHIVKLEVTGTKEGFLEFQGYRNGTAGLSIDITGDLTVRKASSAIIRITEGSEVTIRTLSDSILKSVGTVHIQEAINSNITIYGESTVEKAVACTFVVILSNNREFRFEGVGNTVKSVTGEGLVLCPEDTIVLNDLDQSGLLKFELDRHSDDLVRLPVQTLDAIKLCYSVSESGKYRAILVKGQTSVPQDVKSNKWTVYYNDEGVTELTSEQISELGNSILVEMDPNSRKIYAPRPALKAWVGEAASMPAVRDSDTLYFVY